MQFAVSDVAGTGRTDRTILTTNGNLALAELLDGELEIITAACAMMYGEDPSDRPSPSTLAEWWAALLDRDTGEVLGAMVWRALPYGESLECTAWNVGIRLLPDARGRGAAHLAGRMLAEYLFDTTDVDRIEANTEVANVPGWKGLERAGFHREGITRGVSVRGGERRDMLLYSLMRSDLAGPAGGRTVLRTGERLVLAQAWTDDADRGQPPTVFPPAPHRAALLDPTTQELLGTASWQAVDHGGCAGWKIAITPHVPDIAADAYQIVADHLFATSTLERVEATAHADDTLTRHALEAASFRREGLLRSTTATDLVLYGLLRTDR
jgi:RimJ/RimL family protein N-acetyltransferase